MSPASHKRLTTGEEVEAYLNRTRIQILALLKNAPATSSQIAAKLGVHPANLTRHIRTLLEAGLIQLTERRDTGRNLEKYYRAIALSFEVALDADALTAPHKVALSFARSELSRAIEQLPDEQPGPVKVFVVAASLTKAQQAEFGKALEDLASRFEGANHPEGQPFALVLSLHPNACPEPGNQRIRLSKTRRKLP